MTLLAFLIGLAIPTVEGWLVLEQLQHKKQVLFRTEQWIMGAVLGLMLTAILIFTAHTSLGLPISFGIFCSIHALVLLVLGGLHFFHAPKDLTPPTPAHSSPLSRPARIALGVALTWVIAKTVIAATTFLILTPTYLDDTLDNWNLRGKVFYVDQALTLAMPSEDPITSPLGVSSYPPAVPLMKTWLASVAHNWSDPLVNGLHIVWYIAALSLLYFSLRRILSLGWSATGALMLAGIPLYIMHGTNPYADLFVSVHVFLAVSILFHALRTQDHAARMSFLHIGALAAGVLPFTKNEGLMLYLPPIVAILCVGLWYLHRTQRMTVREILTTLAWYVGAFALLSLPWLLFKWSHGLTFGNAQSVSTIAIGWQKNVVMTIIVNTLAEGNWLLFFPLLITLLVWQWRTAFHDFLPLTFFVVSVYSVQTFLFLFTGLAVEARMQTGLARGAIQQLPTMMLLAALLLGSAGPRLMESAKELAQRTKKRD